MTGPEKNWGGKYLSWFKKKRRGGTDEASPDDLKSFTLPERTQQKSRRMLRDLALVFVIFAAVFVLTTVLDLHSSFEAASLQLKDSPFQYDEVVVALGVLAAALSVFAIRRWRELEAEIVERIKIEKALAESEERYRTLAEAAQDFIFILDRQGKISYVNNFAAENLGEDRKDIVGRLQDEVFPEDMVDQQRLALKEVFKTGKHQQLESKAMFGGRESWQSVFLVPIREKDEEPFDTVLGISRDITARKRSEEALQETTDGLEVMVARRTSELEHLNERLRLELDEKRLAQDRLQAVNRALRTAMSAKRALFSASGEPELLREICRAVVETGGYRFAWVGFAQIDQEKSVLPVASAGYEKGYLETAKVSWDENTELGRGPTGQAIHSGDPSVVRDMLTDHAYQPWRGEAVSRGYASMVALPLVIADNVFGALNIYASEPDAFDDEEVELLKGVAGDLAYGIGALRTRGERDEQAVTLRRTGEQLSLLLESLPIIFYTSEAEGDFGITYVSNNIETITGHNPDELTTDSSFWVDHIHPDDAPRIFEELPKVFQKGYHEYEYRWRSADGSYKWFLDVLRLAKTADTESSYIVGMWLDITARKHGEEELLKVKDSLEDDMEKRQHDLNRTVARLKEKSEELKQFKQEEELVEELDEILQSCLTVDEACSAFAALAARLFAGDSGALYLAQDDHDLYGISAKWGSTEPASSLFGRDDCWALRKGQPHVLMPGGQGMICRHVELGEEVEGETHAGIEAESGAYICVPLRAAGSVLGVLHVLPETGDTGFELDGEAMARKARLTQIVAGHMSQVLFNLMLRRAG